MYYLNKLENQRYSISKNYEDELIIKKLNSHTWKVYCNGKTMCYGSSLSDCLVRITGQDGRRCARYANRSRQGTEVIIEEAKENLL